MQIVIKNLQGNKIPIELNRVKSAVLKIFKSSGIKRSGEIAIYFVDDENIQRLNLKYLNKNYPTDVLSFDISKDKQQLYADIFVSVDMAICNAKIYKTSPAYELYLYVIHGILHILGYDDKNMRQRKLMRRKEQQLIGLLKDFIKAR